MSSPTGTALGSFSNSLIFSFVYLEHPSCTCADSAHFDAPCPMSVTSTPPISTGFLSAEGLPTGKTSISSYYMMSLIPETESHRCHTCKIVHWLQACPTPCASKLPCSLKPGASFSWACSECIDHNLAANPPACWATPPRSLTPESFRNSFLILISLYPIH
jgi:hypothetical protein